ncbi:MAG TPA: AAA family ATPase [Rhodocyclaceae bacterium]
MPETTSNKSPSSAMSLAAACAKLPPLLEGLEAGLVERRRVVRMALLVALSGEHTLLIGPPGTAKSELARRLHHAFTGGRYFERLLTRFSVPEELFGPLSISALEDDRYERQTAGFLPEASIAFIDEVFKANSAILNALLTLLNEREFDNGAGRQRCPLISVIGATNAVPADEVGEAFFDRFLARIPVEPVSSTGFAALLARDGEADIPPLLPLDEAERAALSAAARSVELPEAVVAILADLRETLAEAAPVSDRRWVKLVRLLKTAAASEGRAAVSIWDLALLPACVAADATGQAAVRDWLATRLGVREAFSPPRLTRIVEAFEAQLEIEQNAEDLEYDANGRLQFTAGDENSLADRVGDAKGGAAAPRLSYSRKRRYGEAHIGARTAQLDSLVERIRAYVAELDSVRDQLAQHLATSLWLDETFAEPAAANLAATAVMLQTLLARSAAARAGFTALPRLPNAGELPEPVAHEALPAIGRAA